MSLSPTLKPNKIDRISTVPNPSTTVRSANRNNPTGPILLFVLPAAATLTIWTTDPLADFIYEWCIFLLAGWAVLANTRAQRWHWQAAVAGAIGLWGFLQVLVGATVYRYATLEVSLRYAALAASALAAYLLLRNSALREVFLRACVGFGAAVALLGVAAYYTSPGEVLWLIPSAYPDVWGPFPSRNNFAQFLELVLPVALYLAASASTRGKRGAYAIMGAIVLAAGFASASRAGAVALTLEVLVVAVLVGRWKPLAAACAAIVLILLLAGGTLAGRFAEKDPVGLRREIFQSSVQMITARPWQGFGLGSFREVYPQFASFDAGRVVEHAHSDWLEWAAEGGAGFALVWLAGFLLAARGAWRTMWGLGVPAVFLHALVDDPFARTGVAAWAFILAGAMEATRSRRDDHRRKV
jgi:O-antigen ligase